MLFDQLVRRDGATSIEGLRTSSLRDLTRKLIFVPAGCEFSHWHEARRGGRVVLFYFEPDAIPLDGKAAGDRPSTAAVCSSRNTPLLSTTEKLASLLEGPHCGSRDYVEALGRAGDRDSNRLHDRLRFRRTENGSWLVERLAP